MGVLLIITINIHHYYNIPFIFNRVSLLLLAQKSKDHHYPQYRDKFIISDIYRFFKKYPLNRIYMKNPLNPLNRDKIIIEKFGFENLSVKPPNPLYRGPLYRDSLCIIYRKVLLTKFT